MSPGRMQCKDIPDLPVLRFLLTVHSPEEFDGPLGPGWKTWYWSDDYQPANSVVRAMPEGTPPKLVLATMSRLIERGLVAGCSCGCRGDFEITDKGLKLLRQAESEAA